MKKTAANKIDQNIINKMSHDSNFAYKYLKDNDAVINSFKFFFNKYAMTKRGFVIDELFHDFLVYMLGKKTK